jgi:dinuclear metal center YbgI/SA1388 family protein
MLGNRERDVEQAIVCVDVTNEIADYAIEKGVGLIISHHPLIFTPLKAVTTDTHIGRLAVKLIEAGIAVYSAHTNLDDAEGGVCDCLAEALGLKDLQPCGYGKVGLLDQGVTPEQFAAKICHALDIQDLRFHSSDKKEIKTVAVCPGSSSDTYLAAIEAGADALVTGEIKYSCALEAVQNGLAVYEVGHYQSEKIVLPHLAEYIEQGAKGLQKDVKVIQLYDTANVLKNFTL